MSPALVRIENHTVQGVLSLHFVDGRVASLPHARLRSACPCSECRALRRAGNEVDVDAQVRLDALEPVGTYALNLVFSDGHRRGIYPYPMLIGLEAEDGTLNIIPSPG